MFKDEDSEILEKPKKSIFEEAVRLFERPFRDFKKSNKFENSNFKKKFVVPKLPKGEMAKVEMDYFSSTDKEYLFFNQQDPDIIAKEIKNKSDAQNIKERKKYAGHSFYLVCGWAVFLALITTCQVFIYGLSDSAFSAVFGTATITVFGYWTLVGKYLFNVKK